MNFFEEIEVIKVEPMFNDFHKKVLDFVKKNHYSGSSARGCKYQFALMHFNNLIGVIQIGEPVGAYCQKKYSYFGGKVLELKRLIMIDNTPKNTESWFISKVLNYMYKNTKVESILSYADLEQGHSGIVYKASNFLYYGETSKYGLKVEFNKIKYHIRQAYSSSKTGKHLRKQLLLKKAKLVKIKPKRIYLYIFNRKKAAWYDATLDSIFISHKPNSSKDIFLGEL
jgi:hypothetical protein